MHLRDRDRRRRLLRDGDGDCLELDVVVVCLSSLLNHIILTRLRTVVRAQLDG